MPPDNVSTMVPSPDQLSVRSRRYRYFPVVHHCCGCVTDLKIAAAIIAVLGVVTSPAVSWAFVRHSYVIRVSCFIATDAARADVVDIYVKNVLSFGFGANAGLGPSCLGGFSGSTNHNKNTPSDNTTNSTTVKSHNGTEKSGRRLRSPSEDFIRIVRWIGWILLLADIIFILISLHLLYSIFNPPAKYAARRFITSCVVAITLSFLHGMMYVGVCMAVGGAFPIFEFLFCIIDITAWTYLVIVVNSYRRQLLDDE
ncbi:hypothetical protein PYW08_015947 [Mythimna loreyi]|uniref:Uncharacterized protein n=1 Tax=Mythimna loreyi TaxID=667449 RepID=A0ACC2QSR7_9NEOP|nr:hypothetical protein PYW08_015947 [Mythimna loreyi]